MSRKDYILIAEAIKETLDECETEDEKAVIRTFTSKLASRLKQDNYRFDRERFWNAAIGH